MQAWRTRSFFLALAGLGYVLFAALRSRAGAGPGWIALGVIPFALAFVWIRSAPPSRGVDPVEPPVRSAARVAATGSALVVAAWCGAVGEPGLVAAANLGSALATAGALLSLARISASPGLLQPPASSRRLDAFVVGALVWGIAISLPLARVVLPEQTRMLDPLAIDYATTAAGVGAVGLMIAAAARVRALRRLELGVADRAAAALALSVVVAALAVPSALLRVAPPDRIATIAVHASAWAALFACISIEASSVARTMRTSLAIVLLAAPLGLGAIAWTHRAPGSAGLMIVGVGLLSVLIGLAAPLLSRPLGPARSRWLDAIERANEAALHPDPDVALQQALSAVRTMLPGDSASPVLFRASPPEAVTIDRAGYVHTQEAEAPELLYEVARGEPERTLRIEVLRAVEVRRPEVRPLVAWIDARALLALTLVQDDDGPVGLLGIPRGDRRSPMSLEEVRALRVLADRVGAVLGVSSALARSRVRELEWKRVADRRGDEIDRLKHRIETEGGRLRASVERLAEPALCAAYSPAVSMALAQARRIGSMGLPMVLLTPPGSDPVPWAAVAHLESARKDKPFVVVHATDPAEQALDRWRDADRSPLALADGGSLLIVDPQVLGKDVQDFVAASMAERVSPSGAPHPLDVWLAVSVPSTVDALVASGRLSSVLGDWLGDRALAIPPLASRAEDIRALVLSKLARLGASLRGEPLGIEDRALARLVDYDWPGNDVELEDVLLRATQIAQAPRITTIDLDAIGFVGTPGGRGDPVPEQDVQPPVPRRRARRR